MNLVVSDTSFSYKDFTIFDSINLMISKGEFICLVGANGSGKSTLLKLIFGDIKPSSGEIFIEDSNKQKIRNIPQNVSYLPSNISNPLYLTVNELLRLARYKKENKFQWNLSSEDQKIIEYAVEKCQIEKLVDRTFTELSSGEIQRVWIAFCLVQNKEFLILDESLSNLDYPTREFFFNMLKQISKDNKGILLVTHDLEMANKFSERIFIIKDNKLDVTNLVRTDNII